MRKFRSFVEYASISLLLVLFTVTAILYANMFYVAAKETGDIWAQYVFSSPWVGDLNAWAPLLLSIVAVAIIFSFIAGVLLKGTERLLSNTFFVSKDAEYDEVYSFLSACRIDPTFEGYADLIKVVADSEGCWLIVTSSLVGADEASKVEFTVRDNQIISIHLFKTNKDA